MLFDLPPELVELQSTARRLAQDRVAPRAREIDTTEEYPQDLFELFVDAGLTGLCIPEELSGSGAGILGPWTKSFQTMQEQAASAFKLYIQGFEQAMKSSNFDEMKKYNEIWQNISKNFEQNPYQWSQKAWEDMWKESGSASFKAFFDHWQNIWQNFAKDAEAKSKEALDKMHKQNKP